MNAVDDIAEALLGHVLAAPRAGHRRLVALAGPPASGKSTLSETLAQRLRAARVHAEVVPMDGFHLDNRILSERGILHRKGAPESFDVLGLQRLVRALSGAETVYYPTFDRARDIAIAGSGMVTPDCDTVIVEGNYLLYDAPHWRDLSAHWDLSVLLELPVAVLQQRLVKRWLDHGLSKEQALIRTEENDLVNARLVAAAPMAAHVTIRP